jgi:hypothetical protein
MTASPSLPFQRVAWLLLPVRPMFVSRFPFPVWKRETGGNETGNEFVSPVSNPANPWILDSFWKRARNELWGRASLFGQPWFPASCEVKESAALLKNKFPPDQTRPQDAFFLQMATFAHLSLAP